MNQEKIEDYLQSHGLICHTFAFEELPESIQKKLITTCDSHFNDSYLSLIANAGDKFWTAMQADKTLRSEKCLPADKQENPVDEFSTAITNKLLKMAKIENNADILYPNRFPVPLIALGEHSGWSKPSPLGLGLHFEYGPWFAYRALVKTTHPLTMSSKVSNLTQNKSACLTCIDTPCVNACPTGAVNSSEQFNISRCADYRVRADSTCKLQCHARNACPVGREYQYSQEQRAYHMTHALDALVKWSLEAKSKQD